MELTRLAYNDGEMIANPLELIGILMLIGFVVWILIATYEGGKKDGRDEEN